MECAMAEGRDQNCTKQLYNKLQAVLNLLRAPCHHLNIESTRLGTITNAEPTRLAANGYIAITWRD